MQNSPLLAALQAHYMLGLALLQKQEYSEGVKQLEKVSWFSFLELILELFFISTQKLLVDVCSAFSIWTCRLKRFLSYVIGYFFTFLLMSFAVNP